MAKDKLGRATLYPTDKKILVRVAFLYVGQGSSALVFVKDSDVYRVLLVDINLGPKLGGIDVPRLVKDVLDGADLTAFVNTHPHDDHLCGTQELSDAVEIKEVWHSDHKPSKKYGTKHPELTKLIKKAREQYGEQAIVVIESEKAASDYGQAKRQFLHPTEHLTDEVNDEDPDKRYNRIHEQCGVLKFGNGTKWIQIVGDADRCAFKEHIMKKHAKGQVKSDVLAASHHGSNTFFRENDEQEAYLDGLNAIDPSYVVISAPTQDESPFGHPDDFAMEQYEKRVGEDNVLHTGEERYCYWFDIRDDDTLAGPFNDEGKLAEEYALDDGDDGDDGGKGEKASASVGHFSPPREQQGPFQPRKYA